MADERQRPTRVRLTGLQEAQLPALVELEQACVAMYHEVGFDAAEVPARGTADFVKLTRDHNLHVAEADGVVAGYLAWRDEAPGVAYLADVSVHPDFQRFGIGTQLLDALRTDARSLGLEVVVVRCWTKATWAKRFYERAGFAPIDDAAPEKVRGWRDARSQGRPLTRPGEVALWAAIGVD